MANASASTLRLLIVDDDEQLRESLERIQQEKAVAAAQQVEQFITEIERQIGWTTHPQWADGPVDQRRYDFIRLMNQVKAITEVVQLHVDRSRIREGTALVGTMHTTCGVVINESERLLFQDFTRLLNRLAPPESAENFAT